MIDAIDGIGREARSEQIFLPAGAVAAAPPPPHMGAASSSTDSPDSDDASIFQQIFIACGVRRKKVVATDMTSWSRERPLDKEEMATAFLKFSRDADQMMNRREYQHFTAHLGLDDGVARDLWVSLDTDKNGILTLDEFTTGLDKIFKASTGSKTLRFCPTCCYSSDCAFCRQVEACPRCKTSQFCLECWAIHPGNPNPPQPKRKSFLRVPRGDASVDGDNPS